MGSRPTGCLCNLLIKKDTINSKSQEMILNSEPQDSDFYDFKSCLSDAQCAP